MYIELVNSEGSEETEHLHKFPRTFAVSIYVKHLLAYRGPYNTGMMYRVRQQRRGLRPEEICGPILVISLPVEMKETKYLNKKI